MRNRFRDVRGGSEWMCRCTVRCICHEGADVKVKCEMCGERIDESAEEIKTAEGYIVHGDCFGSYRIMVNEVQR
jgi:hypothetical protein